MTDEELFTAALRIQLAADRLAYLDQTCAGSPEQRTRVARLLAALDDAGSFLNRPLAEIAAIEATVAASGSQSVDSDHASQVGTAALDFLSPSDDPRHLGKLGTYEIEEVIGRGGMGLVLKATDPKLKRVVAIKVLAREMLSNPMAGKRFRREAQAAAAVSHDHIVRIYAVDDESPIPFLVMECIVGQSLQQKIDRKGALELREILRIGMQIAAGLAAAHKQGLVHRDIKPANILLENGIERVKITDFGLARAVDDVGFTQSGQVTGTPQYMSPEQALGEQIDHRSDLFSLGSVLYTMCTGRPAFRATSTVAMLRRVVDDAPRPIGEINPEIPDWLIAIIDRLMAKKPEDRIQTATEVADLLGQHLAHLQEPQRAPKPPTLMRPTIEKQTAPARSGLTMVVWTSLALMAGMVLLFPLNGLGIIKPNDMKGASDLLLTLSLVSVVGFVLVSIWQRFQRGAWRKTVLGTRPVLGFVSLLGMFVLNNVLFTAWQPSPWARFGILKIQLRCRLVIEAEDPELEIQIAPQGERNGIGVVLTPQLNIKGPLYEGQLPSGDYIVTAKKAGQLVFSMPVTLAGGGIQFVRIPNPPIDKATKPQNAGGHPPGSITLPNLPGSKLTGKESIYELAALMAKDAKSKPADTQAGAVANNPQSVKSGAIIEELRKQVDLAAKEVEITKARFQAAQASMFEVRSAEQVWNTAQLRLAEAEGNKKAAIGFARTLVQLSEGKVLIAKDLVTRAFVSPADLRSAEKELSEAKLQLAELDSDNLNPPNKPESPASTPDNKQAPKSPAVLEELRKQVELTAQSMKVTEASHRVGQSTFLELMSAKRDWISARLRLVTAEGGTSKTIYPVMKELVLLLEERASLVRRQVETGGVPASDLNAAEKELSEARIRLLEVPPENPDPPSVPE